jgi:hypothetical protein
VRWVQQSRAACGVTVPLTMSPGNTDCTPEAGTTPEPSVPRDSHVPKGEKPGTDLIVVCSVVRNIRAAVYA